jgi:hypothetical protein
MRDEPYHTPWADVNWILFFSLYILAYKPRLYVRWLAFWRYRETFAETHQSLLTLLGKEVPRCIAGSCEHQHFPNIIQPHRNRPQSRPNTAPVM